MDYHVFYHCEKTGDSVDSSSPYATDRDSMIGMAQQMLRADGDFFGIIDERDVVLQFMMQGDDAVRMEVPDPAQGGAHARVVPIDDLEDVLLETAVPFDVTAIPGLQFEAW